MLVTNRWLLFIKYIESKFSFSRTGSWLKVSISLKPPSRSTTSPTHPFTGRLLRRWNCNWHFDWWMKLKWFFSLSTSSPHIKMCLVNRVNNSNENKRPWHSEFLWTLISILILRPTLKKNLQNSIHERVEKVAPVLSLLKFVKSRYLYNIFMIGNHSNLTGSCQRVQSFHFIYLSYSKWRFHGDKSFLQSILQCSVEYLPFCAFRLCIITFRLQRVWNQRKDRSGISFHRSISALVIEHLSIYLNWVTVDRRKEAKEPEHISKR